MTPPSNSDSDRITTDTHLVTLNHHGPHLLQLTCSGNYDLKLIPVPNLFVSTYSGQGTMHLHKSGMDISRKRGNTTSTSSNSNGKTSVPITVEQRPAKQPRGQITIPDYDAMAEVLDAINATAPVPTGRSPIRTCPRTPTLRAEEDAAHISTVVVNQQQQEQEQEEALQLLADPEDLAHFDEERAAHNLVGSSAQAASAPPPRPTERGSSTESTRYSANRHNRGSGNQEYHNPARHDSFLDRESDSDRHGGHRSSRGEQDLRRTRLAKTKHSDNGSKNQQLLLRLRVPRDEEDKR